MSLTERGVAEPTVSLRQLITDSSPAITGRSNVGLDELLRSAGERVAASTGTWLAALFEPLAAQSVRTYAEAAFARVGHLHTKETDHEIDLIVEGDDRRVVAIEVRLSETVSDRDVRHLNWLHAQLGAEAVSDRAILTTGGHAYRRPDGVAAIPLALLGP